MRFIDGNGSKEAASVKALEELDKGLDIEPLRGDVEDLHFGLGEGGEIRKHLVGERSVLGGADVVRFDSPRAEGRDLVMHQGDERANNNGDAVEQEGRELVAEGFAAACGEEDQAGAALQDVHNYFLLLFPEFAQSKRRPQHLEHPHLHR